MEFMKNRRFIRVVVAALLLTMTSWLLPAELMTERAEAARILNDPRKVSDSSMESGQKVTWDCVWFGSYPQREVICNTDKKSIRNLDKMKKNIKLEYIKVSKTTWNKIVKAKYNKNGDATVGKTKYRRIKMWDRTSASDHRYSDEYYNWLDTKTYHYFRYEPIKWRVLDVNGTDAFLLADKGLDCQNYDWGDDGGSWKKSIIRSWLNGYGKSSNACGISFRSKNFINSAFTSSHRSAVKTTSVNNEADDTVGGGVTKDKVFLLSEPEVCDVEIAASYGFSEHGYINDEGRRSKSSAYTKAMGAYSNSSSKYRGNCRWWLRTLGRDTDRAPITYDGGAVFSSGDGVNEGYYAVRPALHLNISSILWSYAGTVCSDGTTREVGRNSTGTINKPLSGNITVKYKPSSGKSSISLYYEDAFFTKDNSKYNDKLALFSLGTAMATFSTKSVNGNGNIRSLLTEKLKFDGKSYKQYKYDIPTTDKNDTVAYSLAHKTVRFNDGDVTILAVAIRGGAYGGEWGSNGRVTGGYDRRLHKGFSSAAKKVTQKVEAYIKSNKLNKADVKIWVTGFSRGAAVSNLTGHNLVASKIVAPENLYCYTFATPKTAKNPSKGQRGIYNIINPIDIVPEVPPAFWSYGRHGTDRFLPYKTNCSAYSSLLKNMKSRFKNMTGEKYSPYWAHYTLKKHMLSILVSAVGYTEKMYGAYYQKNVSEALAKHVGESNGKIDIPRLFVAIGLTTNANSLVRLIGLGADGLANGAISDIFKNGLSSQLLKQHWPETYMSWLQTATVTNNKSKTVKAKCPVDIEVYNKSTGELVASIKDNEYEDFMAENEDIALEMFVDENGEKQVIIPSDEEYEVRITASGDGSMNYSVTENDEDGQADRKVIYSDVKIEKGDTFNATVGTEQDVPAEDYDLVKNDTEEIEATDDLTVENLDEININVTTEGGGVATGGGEYTSGDSVVLASACDNGTVFEGWYEDGALVSAEDTYGFIAESSRDITARFKSDIKGSRVKLSSTSYVYNGKARKPAVSVSYGARELEENTEYTITYAGGRKNVGRYKVTVKGKGNYTGIKTLYFTINPKSTSISKLRKGKKSFKASWKKVSSQATGYQIQYATSSKFTRNRKSVTIKSYKTTSKNITKLKAKKKYYVRVRSYKKVGKTT